MEMNVIANSDTEFWNHFNMLKDNKEIHRIQYKPYSGRDDVTMVTYEYLKR